MSNATVQQALDTFTPVLRQLAAEHGNEKGAAIFIAGMTARGGQSAGQVAALIVCQACLDDGVTPLATVKLLADCSADPSRIVTALAAA